MSLWWVVKIPAASGGALEGRSLLCWGNLSPKPPNKDAIPPHRKQWGILASFREMGVLYLICWLRHYPQDRGTRPGKAVPRFTLLLRMAYGLRTSLLDFLLG